MKEDNFRLVSAAVSDKGLSDKRPQNEDAYIEIPERGLFAVADGVGGAQAGDVASQMAVELLTEAFANRSGNVDYEDLMKVAIQKANSAIYQTSHELPQLRTMATTLVCLHLDGYIATIGHVGDSRLYRLDPKGNLYRETQDHSVVEDEVRAGRMTLAQAATHPSRNVISRALGAEGSVEVDLKTIMFDPKTTFLLCSDGITRHLSDIEIRELLLTCQTPVEACREMKNLCYNRGAEDNLTAIVVKMDGHSEFDDDGEDEQTIASSRIDGASGSERKLSAPDFSNLSVAALESQDGAMFRVEGGSGVSSEDDVRLYEQMQSERSQIIRSSRSGVAGRLASGFLLVVLGGILGWIVHWGYGNIFGGIETVKPDTASVAAPQNNPAKSKFEETRKVVDQEPDAYLAAIQGAAGDAETLYFQARALARTNQNEKARETLKRAKESLPQSEEPGRESLKFEISVLRAVLSDDQAFERFKNESK